MNIILANHTHTALLAGLNKRLIEDEGHPNPMTIPQLAERMADWLQGEYYAYLVDVDEEIAAYCLYRDDETHYYLRQLYIDRPYRRQGIATHLLDWMYANIWIDKRVRLDVLANNNTAIAFYEHYGFKTCCLQMEK
ncbi:MAG: GNAT family N-acetyltransferase [Anaerolineales bacterium]|nr:GNAT family N-acetyltransferase [Anaerolineales bacterium]